MIYFRSRALDAKPPISYSEMLLANRQLGLTLDVMRLSQRLGLTEETDPDKIEADLTRVVSPAQRVRFCHLLQYHGRRICIAKKPKCAECVIRELCPYPAKMTFE